MEYRSGIGYDIHRLVADRKLFLGGVEIPFIKGLFGHSDADVLMHAIADALLGAISEGDIGEHFPDTDPEYANITGVELLERTYEIVKGKKFLINNIDAIVIAEEPKILPFKKQMQERIAGVLEIGVERVSIKGKTSEKLGEIGQQQAIASFAIASLVKGK